MLCRRGHDKAIVGTRSDGSCSECCRENVRKWRSKSKKQQKLSDRRSNLRKAFGISIEEYEAMVLKQGGVCAICKGKPALRHGEARLHVDHDHVTGKIRALLCSKCNLGIGQFQDSVLLLHSAIAYLEMHHAS